MRPLSLIVEGFTCFSERQEPLDFRALHLFAIAGPTGAGKSSILDAMTFALYGYVPRLGKAGADLITTGRDRLAVQFEFAVGERTFRVARTLRRRQGAKVVLEETTGGRVRPLSDKVVEANATVERIVGIGYDGFSQSVVLPQGRFDTFLRGAGGDRRDLLKGLLGLERYEQMRKAAAERRSALDAEVRAVSRQLDDLAGATEAALEERRAQLAAAEAESERTQAEERRAAEDVEAARARRRLTLGLEVKRAELEQLQARTPEMDAATARLEAARRAAPLLPAIREADTAAARVARVERLLNAASARESETAAAVRRAAAAARDAADAAQAIPALREKIAALHRIHDAVVRRDAAIARRPALEAAVAAAERELAAKKKAAAALEKRRDAARAAHGQARRALDAVAYSPELHHLLEPIFAEAARANDAEARLATLRASRERAAAAHEQARQAAARAAEAARQARRLLESRQRDYESCIEALARARDTQMAAVLRHGLHTGAPCPVCEQEVAALPAPLATPELDALQAQVNAARTACDDAHDECRRLEEAATAARVQADDTSALERLDDEIDEVARQIARADAGMQAAIAGASITVAGDSLRAWIVEETSRLRALRADFDAASRAVDDADRQAQSLEHDLVAASADVERAADALARATQAQRDNEQERQALAERIAAVTTAPEPEAERMALEQQLQALEQRRDAAGKAAHAAEVEHRAAVDAVGHLRDELDAERQTADGLRRTADAARADAGFAADADVLSAALDPDEYRALDEMITQFQQCLKGTADRVRELETELGADAVSEEALTALVQRHDAARMAREQALAQVARLRADVDRLAHDVSRAQLAAAELERHRRALDVVEILARELGGDRFQQYLLEDTLENLVRGASVRLKELSGRYTLEWRDDRFHVVDHDNARERRIADTLSGGETFLASLALALELSEQIQRSAGAVRIDSLFIDEGFGTLDPDTLGVVAEAIESLQVGGRMVGIITHIEELTERLPGCIRIAKRPGQGSTWCVERSA